jgi:hypothetical protein
MLFPSKHSHPDRTLLAASTRLLKELRRRRVVEFDDLARSLTKTAGPSTDYLFMPAVSLLYVLGLVDYHAAADSFEYRGK